MLLWVFLHRAVVHLAEVTAAGSHQQTVAVFGIVVGGEDAVGIPLVEVAVVVGGCVADGALALVGHRAGTS